MSALPAALHLPARLQPSVWRGSEVGAAAGAVRRSGWAALDAELPGGGWPVGELIEVLCPRLGTLEWRLLAPALRPQDDADADTGPLVLIGPPHPPFLPGLLACGLAAEAALWIRAHTLAERLWAAEQMLQTQSASRVLLWLPQSPPPQALRRLHTRAGAHLLLALRPAEAAADASPAPLRVEARLGLGWTLQVQLRKRRGPPHEGVLTLPALPSVLQRACAAGNAWAVADEPVSARHPLATPGKAAMARDRETRLTDCRPDGAMTGTPSARAPALVSAHLAGARRPPSRQALVLDSPPSPHPRLAAVLLPAGGPSSAASASAENAHVVARFVSRDDLARRCG